ncbi:nickel pincer cofactor biosynthesis protein LarB [Salsuginibacillus kocurii]|uniref:nickel pincer cofactor biosynthesis protein LarB n=1 Tax=Salsuginibacillus kocurii TaxID=427078 RepID=UPI00036C5E60|nr:nickel pincer cofactor biosynthesis protein LarB [Salsuginibacillus kocurii]
MKYEDLGFCKVDYDREERTGYPEIIYGEGKSADHIKQIMAKLLEKHGKALATRVSAEKAEFLIEAFPHGVYHPDSNIFRIGQTETSLNGKLLIVSAGTSDLPVAEEVQLTAEWMGCDTETIQDVGVAGLDRLLSHKEQLQTASVLVVVAGMEGALPSVIGGLVKRPVIAVPTSVGYGAHLQGLTPLLSMLTSCASGVSVVNIDNGFGAASQASLILKLANEGADT